MLEVLTDAVCQENDIKSIQTKKKEIKLPLSSDGMTVYIENPNASTKKFLELISEFSKVTRYKINIQKPIVLLYQSSEHMDIKTQKILPFIIIQNKKISTGQNVQDLR